MPSPVGAAEALALAGGEVGLVDRLYVGLGMGDRPALRRRGTDPAAAERGAGQTLAKKPTPRFSLQGKEDLQQPRMWPESLSLQRAV